MNETEKILRNAIGTGEVVKIRYGGGSQRGAAREIVPLKIEGELLEAKCLVHGKTKTFNMEKISIAEANEKITYDKDFYNHEVICSVCGTKFRGEPWRTYCNKCYKKKKQMEEEDSDEDEDEDYTPRKPLTEEEKKSLKKFEKRGCISCFAILASIALIIILWRCSA